MTRVNSATSSERVPQGTTAIVTGAAGGIGSAEAELLAAAGHHVVLNDVDERRLAEVVESLGGPSLATAVAGDIADADTARRLVAAATSADRALAVVVNNAGITADRMVFNMTDDDWDRALAINLRGTFLLTREAAKYWRAVAKSTGTRLDASLVNTTSRAALMANPGQTNYAAAKAGVVVLTQIVARELAAYGVRANAVAPRAFTAMMRTAFGDFREEELARWSPHHVARFVAYLCSPAGADISGQIFVVKGTEVSLTRSWEIQPPTDIDFSAAPAAVDAGMDRVFAGADRWIAPFQIGDDLPTTDGTRA